MRTHFFRTLGTVTLAMATLYAQKEPAANYDESKVPAYHAARSTRCREWTARHQGDLAGTPAELLDVFAREMYGRTPSRPKSLGPPSCTTRPAHSAAWPRRQVTFMPEGTASIGPVRVLIYRPAKATGPVPVFLALNFKGNHAINPDPGIELTSSWLPDDEPGVVGHKATEASRGTDRSRWPLETILSRGYAVVTAYYGDFDPDVVGGFEHGVQALFYRPGQHSPEPDEWGAIGGWAWGLSRILDYIASDRSLDAKHVAVLGHSRLGKAALWAAAQDERFALVVSNESGCGGAALSKRIYGETVQAINDQFPHWFAGTFKSTTGGRRTCRSISTSSWR